MSGSLAKNRALSSRVAVVSVFRRVLDTSEDGGSLNPMWPLRPMPSSCKSIPPAFAMRRS